MDILKDIDWAQYRLEKKEIVFTVSCTLNGYNLELLDQLNNQVSLEDFKRKMGSELKLLLSVLKAGVKNEI